MDYEKLKKPANVLKNSKHHDDQKTAINASIPKIANAQKAQWPNSQIHNNQAENHIGLFSYVLLYINDSLGYFDNNTSWIQNYTKV